MTQAYPLQWPSGRPRTKTRRHAQFNKKVYESGHSWTTKKDLSIADALSRLQGEIDRMALSGYVLSTNVPLRLDGAPRSAVAEPDDPGACLYFTLKGKPHALPCDTYYRVADNIVAIAKHLEATRAIERYGVATMSEMFAGFTALPQPKTWRDILGIGDDEGVEPETIEKRFRDLAKMHHPDRPGGSHSRMAEISAARDAGLREIGG